MKYLFALTVFGWFVLTSLPLGVSISTVEGIVSDVNESRGIFWVKSERGGKQYAYSGGSGGLDVGTKVRVTASKRGARHTPKQIEILE